MPPEPTSDPQAFDFKEIGHHLARMIMAQEERACQQIVVRWLPRGLKWMVDHPRLLRWYLKLPHRTRPLHIQQGDRSYWTIG